MIKSIFTLFIYLLIGLSASLGQTKKAESLLDSYMGIAHNEMNSTLLPFARWQDKDTLRYLIKGELTYLNEKQWSAFMTDLSDLTGITLQETKDEKSFHVVVYFGQLSSYFRFLGREFPVYAHGRSNWNSRQWTSKYALTRASFCIDPAKNRELKQGIYLVKKNFLRSLGLLGKSADAFSLLSSTFNGSNSQLGKQEKRFVKLHYHPSLSPGMQPGEVRKALLENVDLDALLKEKL